MNKKEQNFWKLIQNEAERLQGHFFMDSGEGYDINTEQYEGEDFSVGLFHTIEWRNLKKTG